MAGTVFWSAWFILVAGLATWLCLGLWGRHIRRDVEAARRQVAAREAAAHQQQAAERRAAAELAASERRHRALTEAGAIAVWRAGPDGVFLGIEGWTPLTGQPAADVCGRRDGWLEPVHPEDRAGAAAAWAQAIVEGGAFDIELRIRTPLAQGGEPWRWCRARAVPVRAEAAAGQGEGRLLEWIGVVEDIHARRRAEEDRQLLSREVNHRAKNLLAVVQTVVRMTRAEDPAAFVATLMARLAALARAHALLAEQEWRGADLRSIAERELAAFLGEGARVSLPGERLPLLAVAVQPIAMVLHELTTNAAKYGCLAGDGMGVLLLSWQVQEEELRITWCEAGGPERADAPMRTGFGSRLIDGTIRHQLGGRIEREWRDGGLVCHIALPAARVVEAARLPIRAA